MGKWMTVALALTMASGAYAGMLDPGWTSLDDFSVAGNLGAPKWSAAGAVPVVSDGNKAFALSGAALAMFDSSAFPGSTYPQRTRISAFSGGITTAAQYVSDVLGYQDSQNYLELRASVNNVQTGGFYRMFLYEVSNGVSTRRNQYLNLDNPSAIRLDAWLDGSTLKLEVQPLNAQTGEPTGSVSPYTWTDIPASYSSGRKVGVGSFGAVKIDDYLGYTIPEPMTWLLLACPCALIRRPRCRRTS